MAQDLMSKTAPSQATDVAWELERRLSRHSFRGVPVGSGLAGILDNDIRWQTADWSLRDTLKNRARYLYHNLYLHKQPPLDGRACNGRVLVTWISPNFRHKDLVIPIAERLGYDRCVLLHGNPSMAGLLPVGAAGIDAQRVVGSYDSRAWRRDYFQLWRKLRPELRRDARELPLPSGGYARIADAVVTLTQQIAGFIEFLERAHVVAVLTEHDRYAPWTPLVLSARRMGIPTYTLMHGVFGEDCAGYYPVLADKIFCWGPISEAMLVTAGCDPGQIVIGGCPRLTRDLPMLPVEARARIGLDAEKPVVVLANQYSSVDQHQLKLAEVFCRAIQEMKQSTGIVRLHPVDRLDRYSGLMAR
jgi:hypothetical protein